MTIARKDMAETAAARSTIYGFLATVFRAEPSAAFLARLAGDEFAGAFASLEGSLPDQLNAPDRDRLAEDLAVEYTRLFIGPGPHISPHESVNIETGHALEASFWGTQTVTVKKFIEATGLQYADAFTDMPDHISVEFEFMQTLAAKEEEAWANGDAEYATNLLAIERRFFDEHLDRWVPRFCDRVIAEASLDFYRAMAELTKQILAFERQNLGAETAESQSRA